MCIKKFSAEKIFVKLKVFLIESFSDNFTYWIIDDSAYFLKSIPLSPFIGSF